MNSLYDWMVQTPINDLVMGYPWTWPALETFHFLGLCLLIGAVLIMDLRLIGFQSTIPLRAVHALMPIAIVGFVVNLITGLGFLFGDAHLYAPNWAFWAKMGLVFLAGINFLYFYFKVEPGLEKLGPHDATPMIAKTVGALSLAFWFGVLAFGRLLPYLGTGGG